VTDAKRLPVIYLSPGTVEMLSDPEQYRYVANHYHHPDETHTVAFGPAVGRCATCRCFLLDEAKDKARCVQWDHPRPVPVDGSWFCGDHHPKEPAQ
jgi:hypothetical protein